MKHVVYTIAALLVATTANAQEFSPVRTISVTGHAERKIVPDQAHLNVNLNSMEMLLGAAKSAHDAKLSTLIAIVRGAGIEEKKIRSDSSSTQPVYTYENNPKTGQSDRVFKGYRVQTNLDITVEDTSKLADLMDQITNAGFEKGANTEWGNLLSTYYTVSDPQKIQDEMLIEAIANAKAKAQRMAAAAGASLSRVYQMSDGTTQTAQPSPMPMMMMAKGAAADSAEASIAPPAGEQEVTSTVSVVYELQ